MFVTDAPAAPMEDDPTPYDDDEYAAHCLREAAIVRTRERRRCFTCLPVDGLVRRVTSTFTTQAHFDPTLAYRLTCGHATIDV